MSNLIQIKKSIEFTGNESSAIAKLNGLSLQQGEPAVITYVDSDSKTKMLYAIGSKTPSAPSIFYDMDKVIYELNKISSSVPTNVYTKSEVDTKLGTKVDKTTTVNGKALSNNITLTAGDVNALPSTTTYAGSITVGGAATSANKVNSTLTIKANGTTINTFDGSVNKDIEINPSVIGAYTKTEVDTKINLKQDKLVSGSNIKTIQGNILLGSGNINLTAANVDALPSNTKYAISDTVGGAATSANKVNSGLEFNSSSDGTGISYGYFDGSTPTTIVPSNLGLLPNTTKYAASTTVGGKANQVANSFTIKLNGGTTENTNMFTYDGATAKTLDITPSKIGALPITGGTVNGNIYIQTNSLTETAYKGIGGSMTTNEGWGIYGGGTVSDVGYLDIFTIDNATEPIYISQYNTPTDKNPMIDATASPTRRFVVLDNIGNTTAPGKITANSFIKSGSDDNSVLLGGGGTKLINDFTTTTLSTYKPTINSTTSLNGFGIGSYISQYDVNYLEIGKFVHVIGCAYISVTNFKSNDNNSAGMDFEITLPITPKSTNKGAYTVSTSIITGGGDIYTGMGQGNILNGKLQVLGRIGYNTTTLVYGGIRIELNILYEKA